MTVFLDANVFIYAVIQVPSARDLQMAVANGSLVAKTSIAVLEEIWHVELRSKSVIPPGTTRATIELMRPLIEIDESTFTDALNLAAPTTLGANDRVHVATCRAHGITAIVTADSAFDGVAGLQRFDPLDGSAIESLLAV